jgi:FkbM family methyltransferase
MASLAKLLSIAVEPRAWAPLRHGVAATMDHRVALDRFRFNSVIDVGANKGQFAAFAMATWPEAKLYCFEPLPGPRAKLTAVTAGKARVFDCALGVEEGHAEMHIASRDDSSSLLPLGDRQKSLYNMTENGALRVPVHRLDACLPAATLARPALLKIDVQGFELQVLNGGTELLGAIDVVYAELSLVELYKGQALANEVIAVLEARGFVLAGVYNQALGEGGEAVQADFLFTRRAA